MKVFDFVGPLTASLFRVCLSQVIFSHRSGGTLLDKCGNDFLPPKMCQVLIKFVKLDRWDCGEGETTGPQTISDPIISLVSPPFSLLLGQAVGEACNG